MADMWESLGFSESPYDARPLRPVAADEELLVNRESESIDFCTTIDSTSEGFLVLSGSPGVGKTSFFNVQQYRLATETAAFGPKLLPSFQLSSIYPRDEPRAVALRALEGLIKSVRTFCSSNKKKVPAGTVEISKWVLSKGGNGIEVGLTILGIGGNYGRTIDLPAVDNISFEGLQAAIECIVSECVNVLEFEGVFIALDNIENLENEEMKNLLMIFRDTLFSVPRAWWVLIGQSGLGSLIQTLDRRVSDRLTGSGLELKPLSFDELENAIALRVKKFSKHASAKSPLPTSIHRTLYDASGGETRFVFKYSHEICTKYVNRIRSAVISSVKRTKTLPDQTYISVANKISSSMINDQIPEATADSILREIVTEEFGQMALRHEDKAILKKFFEKGEARPKDYKEFACESSQQFYSKFVSKLHDQNLLSKRQQGSAVYYQLRGIASLACKFSLM